MNIHNAALKVDYTTAIATIYLNGNVIGSCKVFTRFNHCFENDYFTEAYETINTELKRITGLTPGEAGTIGVYKLNYSFK